MDVLWQSIPDIAKRVAEGDVSATERCEASLARIAAIDDDHGAFLSVAADSARAAARAVDERRARGETLGSLAGVPVAVKDVLCTADQPTSAGSKILMRDGRAWQPPYDATSVARLRQAGAVLVGKAN